MQWCERRGRGVVGGCSVYSKVLDRENPCNREGVYDNDLLVEEVNRH